MYGACLQSELALFTGGYRRGRGFGGYGGGFWADGIGGDIDRSGFAPVSQRAMNALDDVGFLSPQDRATTNAHKSFLGKENLPPPPRHRRYQQRPGRHRNHQVPSSWRCAQEFQQICQGIWVHVSSLS